MAMTMASVPMASMPMASMPMPSVSMPSMVIIIVVPVSFGLIGIVGNFADKLDVLSTWQIRPFPIITPGRKLVVCSGTIFFFMMSLSLSIVGLSNIPVVHHFSSIDPCPIALMTPIKGADPQWSPLVSNPFDRFLILGDN